MPSSLPSEGDSSSPDDPLPPFASDMEIPTDEQGPQPSLLDLLFNASGSDDVSEGTLSDETQTEEKQNESVFQRIITVLIGTIVFVLLVGVLAFFARRHFEHNRRKVAAHMSPSRDFLGLNMVVLPVLFDC